MCTRRHDERAKEAYEKARAVSGEREHFLKELEIELRSFILRRDNYRAKQLGRVKEELDPHQIEAEAKVVKLEEEVTRVDKELDEAEDPDIVVALTEKLEEKQQAFAAAKRQAEEASARKSGSSTLFVCDDCGLLLDDRHSENIERMRMAHVKGRAHQGFLLVAEKMREIAEFKKKHGMAMFEGGSRFLRLRTDGGKGSAGRRGGGFEDRRGGRGRPPPRDRRDGRPRRFEDDDDGYRGRGGPPPPRHGGRCHDRDHDRGEGGRSHGGYRQGGDCWERQDHRDRDRERDEREHMRGRGRPRDFEYERDRERDWDRGGDRDPRRGDRGYDGRRGRDDGDDGWRHGRRGGRHDRYR